MASSTWPDSPSQDAMLLRVVKVLGWSGPRTRCWSSSNVVNCLIASSTRPDLPSRDARLLRASRVSGWHRPSTRPQSRIADSAALKSPVAHAHNAISANPAGVDPTIFKAASIHLSAVSSAESRNGVRESPNAPSAARWTNTLVLPIACLSVGSSPRWSSAARRTADGKLRSGSGSPWLSAARASSSSSSWLRRGTSAENGRPRNWRTNVVAASPCPASKRYPMIVSFRELGNTPISSGSNQSLMKSTTSFMGSPRDSLNWKIIRARGSASS